MARGKTVYIKSESGKVESFDQFRDKLRNLATPEKMRFKELRSLLMKEAQPLGSIWKYQWHAQQRRQCDHIRILGCSI